jgi:hypothetical protein
MPTTTSKRPAKRSTLEDLERLRRLLETLVPSAPWEDVAVVHLLKRIAAVKTASKATNELRRAEVFPPGGAATGMKRCRHCGRWTPPYLVSDRGWCEECRTEEGDLEFLCHLPGSPGCVIGINSFDRGERLPRQRVKLGRANRD